MLDQLGTCATVVDAVIGHDIGVIIPQALDLDHTGVAARKAQSDLVIVVQLRFKVLDIHDDAFISPLCRAFGGIGGFECFWRFVACDGFGVRVGVDFAAFRENVIFQHFGRGFNFHGCLGHSGTAVVSLISSITKLAEISETEIREVSRL